MVDSRGSDYIRWNDALAARFFSEDNAGQPVYLFVTPDVVAEVGAPFGEGLDEFLVAVRTGPPGATRTGHCQRALQIAMGWRERGVVYPPYIAYLALFVLAGGHEGEFDPRSYYPRLWELLGEKEAGTPPSFDRMLELWDDLERWSVDDRHGDLGLFEARIVGGKIHIGLPLAQTVLTETERHSLPLIFASAHLDASSQPSDRELRRALTLHGRSRLRTQTLEALERGTGSFSEALLEIVSDQFLDWNGEVPSAPTVGGAAATITAGLRLCLTVDRVSGRGIATLRCRSMRDLPDSGLLLTSSDFADRVTCQAFLPGWSQAISQNETSAPVAPPDRAWRFGLTLTDPERAWTLRMRPQAIRIFVEGGAEQLPGLVEVLEVPRNAAFYLAFPDSHWTTLQPWIESECEGWEPIQFSALPRDWTFGSVTRATTDRGPRDLDLAIGFPDRRTLRLLGGIRAKTGKGNTFFNFAPPDVVLDGGIPGDAVVCNGSSLSGSERDPSRYKLPQDLPLDVRVGLEVRNGEDVLIRRSLYLVSGSPWRLDAPIVKSDSFGRIVEGVAGIAGADVEQPASHPFSNDPLRTPGLDSRAPRVYFVGRYRGEIVTWPTEPLPEWVPVWAVPFGRHGKALYCGTSMSAERPLAERRGDRSHLKLWHHVLWQSRAQITPPHHRSLKALWRQYQDAARG